MIKTATVLTLLSVFAACGADVAEFGEPHSVDARDRSIVWHAGTGERLAVDPMGAARKDPSRGMSGGADSSGGGVQVVANTPVGWEQLDKTSQFRNASWRVADQPDSDCYLTVGVGGGAAMNLSRWYKEQFGLMDVPSVDALPQTELANRVGRLCEIEGTFMGSKENWAALIAWFDQGGSVTSLKFTGPAAVVKGNRQQFLELAKSIRIASASPDPKAPPIQRGDTLPAGHPDIGGGQAQSPPPAPDAPFTASVPAGWSPKPGSRRWLHHSIGEASEVYVGTIGGGLKQSLDIWRNEMQTAAMSDEQFQNLPQALFLGEDAVLMDLSGSYRGMSGVQIADARMLVAARLDGSTITFCKLVGPAMEVVEQRDAFVQFCGSVRRAQ